MFPVPRSFDVYGFCHSQYDSLQGDEDMLKVKVRKNEQDAHRVLHVSYFFTTDSVDAQLNAK